ncbi:hypothetical protein L195_g022015 [Trifolium pratense]|uniref:Uncharacterized protein n=1 Tax=Trifolium pratense TaxID=57577 RepID=A0A2K3N6U8_TRIPR|nr:hypothetical protein L195_g021196 [Trifolium pratense]PNX98758.1 hypothetical protein L195_g022015 [Trifolium pratense]
MEELPGGTTNFQISLLISVDMTNTDVRRVLVDQGSSCDIMYAQLFKTLQLDETYLTPYLGSDLTGFNGATTKPWGYVDLVVTFGSQETSKTIKVKFLVVDRPSLYQCIMGRTAITDLIVVPSTAHLKMKYYTHMGQIATLHGEAPEAKKTKTPTSPPTPNISLIDLDSPSKEHRRPIPDGEFELVPFGEDPSRGVKIGTGLPDLARKQLKACLRENTNLFARHASEMPGLDPIVACHQLTIDPAASAIVQCRRRQSPEKADAAGKAVKDLLETNFIYEARYTTWLSNVVLVKKSNGKWSMCCDYTDLNSACPKDSYPLTCI